MAVDELAAPVAKVASKTMGEPSFESTVARTLKGAPQGWSGEIETTYGAELLTVAPNATFGYEALAVTTLTVGVSDTSEPETPVAVVCPALRTGMTTAIEFSPGSLTPLPLLLPAPAVSVEVLLPAAKRSTPTGENWMVKFTFEMSKKMLPTASTLMRAVVVLTFGTMMVWLPSLGVLSAMTMGNVWPPSVDSEILTLAALMGAALVPLTAQVTVC